MLSYVPYLTSPISQITIIIKDGSKLYEMILSGSFILKKANVESG